MGVCLYTIATIDNIVMIAICITVEEKTLRKIDSVRGLIPRSTYIQDILNKNLKKGDS
jgi:hypothetical protein